MGKNRVKRFEKMNRQNIIKTSQRLLKIIRWTSIIFLCLWILIPVLGFFIPLEFANKNSELIYTKIRFCGLPIAAILLVLTYKIKNKHTPILIVYKIILAIGVAFLFYFIAAIILLGSSMCAWTTDKVFFENRQNHSVKIVQRSFGCGATDSDYPTVKVFKIREITPVFIWVTKIDTNKINKNEWIRIENTEKYENY